jgi:hypothetical protein
MSYDKSKVLPPKINKNLKKKITKTNLGNPSPKTPIPLISSPIIINEFFLALRWCRRSVTIDFCLTNLLLLFLKVIIIVTGGHCRKELE